MRDAFVVAGLAITLMAVGAVGGAAKPESTTQINLRTALTFNDNAGCNRTPARPCGDRGTFTAKDRATAIVLCAKGTMAESYYFPPSGSSTFTIAERTLTCPDGSTLVMHVRRVMLTELTATTNRIGETWKVTLGTGRFTLLKGRGTMEEIYNTGRQPATLGGSLTGALG
jgi:hypothetical protein